MTNYTKSLCVLGYRCWLASFFHRKVKVEYYRHKVHFQVKRLLHVSMSVSVDKDGQNVRTFTFEKSSTNY